MAVAVFFLALAVRMIYLLEIKDSHLIEALMGDGELFDLWAQKIAAGRWLGDEVFFQAPFYPYFLAIAYTVFGRDLWVLRIIQSVIGAGAGVMVALAATRFFSPKAGWIAGVLLAFYPAAVFFDGLVQKAGFGFFFMAMLLMLLARTLDSPKTIIWLPIGLCLGLFVLVRENALIMLAVVVIWAFFYFRRTPLRRRAVWVLLVLVGAGIALFPVALRNKIVGGEFVLTTSNLGYNLYVGNNRNATGTYSPMVWGRGDWRYELSDAVRLAETEAGRSLTAAEVSSFWTRKALSDIGDHPLAWARLMIKKWLLVWNDTEISDTESIYAYRHWSLLLRVLGRTFTFGALTVMAFWGMALTWRHRRRLWLLYALLVCYAASISLFFVFARYRQPMVAVMILFAAAGIAEGYRLVRHKKFRRVLVSAVVAAAAALITYWPLVPPAPNAANTFYNWGTWFEERQKPATAVEYYTKAVELNPQHTMALNNLGIVTFQQGRAAEAIGYFRRAIRLRPDMAQIHMNLGIALYAQGRLDQALDSFKESLQHTRKVNPVTAYNIACIYSLQNEIDEALAWLSKAIRHGYRDFDRIDTDADLTNVRQSARFAEFIRQFSDEGGAASGG